MNQSAVAIILALSLGLGASSCASRVSLRDADPAKEAVVFGRVQGWIIGPQELGPGGDPSSHNSLRCDGFYLLDRKSGLEYPLGLATSGFFEAQVSPGEYLLMRAGRRKLPRQAQRTVSE